MHLQQWMGEKLRSDC